MVNSLTLIALLSLICGCFAEDVTVIKRNFPSRRRRYLIFPNGSAITARLASVKAVQQVQPTLWNMLAEMEIPFMLPSDLSIFRRKNRVGRDRREIYATLKTALNTLGYDGNACVKKMVCEAKHLEHTRGMSMVNDMIHAIFTYSEIDFNYKSCEEDALAECSISFLGLLLKEAGDTVK